MNTKQLIFASSVSVLLLLSGMAIADTPEGNSAANLGFLAAPSSFPRVVGGQPGGGGFDELDEDIISENFNGGVLPGGWTVQDSGDNEDDSWAVANFGQFGGFDGTDLIWVSSAGNGATLLDERLITVSFSTVGYNSVVLSFDHWYFDLTANDYATVDVSISGITGPWINAATYTAETEDYPTYVDLSGIASGEADVRIRFRYYDGGDEALYWFIDNVLVEGYAEGDAFPPVITLVSYPTVNFDGQETTIVATVTDDSGIASFDLTYAHYVNGSAIDQSTIAMTPTVNPNEYSAAIPGLFQSEGDSIAWSLLAVDGSVNANERRSPSGANQWYFYNVYNQDDDIPWGEVDYFWTEINQTGTDLDLENNEIVEVVFSNYGFGTFNWYGQDYDRIRVCSNGWITFSNELIAYSSLPEFPETSNPNNVIALFASNLDPSSNGSVYVGVDNGRFIIEWDDLYFYNREFGPTGQIVLDPVSKRAYLNYENVNPNWDRPVTIGYENQAGDLGYTILYGIVWAGLNSETTYRIGRPYGISGTVTDVNASPLEGVDINAYFQDTFNLAQSATTDVLGEYELDNLGPGFYDVTAYRLGFVTDSTDDIEVIEPEYTAHNVVLSGVPPDAFNLTGPADGSTCWSGDTTLTWEATTDPDPADPVTYVVWWATDAGFSQDLDSAQAIAGTSYNLTGMMDNETYWWKVRAVDSHTTGTWSTQTWTVDVFIPDAPGAFSLSSPEDEAVVNDDTVTVSWTASIDSDEGDQITYEVQWTDDPEGDLYIANTTETQYTITDLANPAAALGIRTGEIIRTGGPWQAAGNGELDELPDDQTIYWRVKAVDTYNLETWASPGPLGWSFNIYVFDPPDGFDLLSPEDGCVCWTGDTTLTWTVPGEIDPGDEIQSYVIWWATDEGFTENLDSAEVGVPNTSYLLEGMLDDQTYWWKVRAVDLNTDGTWCDETWTIDVYIPEPPGDGLEPGEEFELTLPEDGVEITEDQVSLQWSVAYDPDPDDIITYTLQWSMNNEFPDDETTFEFTTMANSHIVTDLTEDFDDNTVYWRVKAFDTFDLETWAAPGETGRSFTVNISEPPADFSLLSPENEEVLDALDWTFTWEEAVDPDIGDVVNYTVYLSNNADLSDSTEYVAGTETSLEIQGLTDDSQYWWTVFAIDTNTEGTWALDTLSFTTAMPELPSAFALLTPTDLEVFDLEDPFEILFAWEESQDPDPGESVTYDFFLHLVLDDGVSDVDTTFQATGLEVVEYTADIPGILETDYWADNVSGEWWIIAISGDDQVNCDSNFGFDILPHSSVSESMFNGIPTRWDVAGIYPNPFNPTVQIVIAVPSAAMLRAEVYDVLGRRLTVLSDNRLQPGYHRFSWNAEGPSGIYFLRVKSETGWSTVRKLLFVK